MSSMPVEHGNGARWRHTEQDREKMEEKELLRAMYAKISDLEIKLDTVISAVGKIVVAVQNLNPKQAACDTEDENIDDEDYDDDGIFERKSSSYLVINTLNNSKTQQPEDVGILFESPATMPQQPQSPICFSAISSDREVVEPLEPLQEGAELHLSGDTASELTFQKPGISLEINETHDSKQKEEVIDDNDDDSDNDDDDDDDEEEEEDEDDSESSSKEDFGAGPVSNDLDLPQDVHQIQSLTPDEQKTTKHNILGTHTVNFGFPQFTRIAESPLPTSSTFQQSQLDQCRRKKVPVSEDNRRNFFQREETFKEEIPAGSSMQPTEALCSSVSENFVPNNQLISVSGFKNDHGLKDNRFDEEAHSDTMSFLTSFKSDLPNLTLIQNGVKPANGDSSGNDEPAEASRLQDGALTEEAKPSKEDADAGNQNSQSPAASMNSSVESIAGSGPASTQSIEDVALPQANTPPPVNEEEKETFVGDAYIQALLQKQRQKAEASSDPKSQSSDTVICLDLSQSMLGKPLEAAKSAILTFLNGIEIAAVEYGLEENVALVTFGRENEVKQHLTNNYDGIRDVLDELEAGGPSPMWLGLAISLTELSTRGGLCSMRNLSVLPRIILISDGFATERNRISGQDSTVTDEMTSTMIQSLVMKNRKTFSTLCCISTRVCNKPLLLEISNGQLFTDKDMCYLAEYFRVKDVISECLSKCDDMQMTEKELVDIVHTYNLQEPRSVQEVLNELKSRVTLSAAAPAENVREVSETPAQPNGVNQDESAETKMKMKESEQEVVTTLEDKVTVSVAASTEKPEKEEYWSSAHAEVTTQEESVTAETQKNESVTPVNSLDSNKSSELVDSMTPSKMNGTIERGLPAFGTRVLANPGSENHENTKNLFGTVVGFKNDQLKILWSDGKIQRCCYIDGGQLDVRVIDDAEVDNSTMRIGARVERGVDWRWKDQDGGKGNAGIVYKVDEEKKVVHVFWPSGSPGNYRYGYRGRYDLQLVSNQRSTENHDDGDHAGKVEWQIELLENEWETFSEEVSQSIEDMYICKPRNTFLIKTEKTSYRISLTQPQARDLETQNVYAIRRRVAA